MDRLSLKKYFPSIFFVFSLGLYFFLANLLRNGPDFNDETEKLVGAMMISDGTRIYKDMFAHHGPFSYMLAHLFYKISGSQDLALFRFIPIIFSIFSIAAIKFSPAIKKTNFRLFAAAFFALNLALMQTIYGLMLGMYQVYAGHLFICVLALVIIPVIAGIKVPRFLAFLGGLSLGFIFFSGYSFVVACGFFGLIIVISAFVKNGHQAQNRITLYNAILGVITSIVVVTIYLYFFGDIEGYGVYHFYFNQVIYAKFSNYRPLDILHFVPPIVGYFTLYTPPSSWLSYVISSSVSVFTVFFILSLKNKNKPLSIISCIYGIVLMMGIIFADPRAADDFQMNTLVIVVTAFIPLITCFCLNKNSNWKLPFPSVIIITSCLIFISFIISQFSVPTYLYNTSAKKYYKMKGSLAESKTAEFNLLRTIVLPAERVQQFPYNSNFYIQMNRLPASGNYYYLPWQDKYFQDPILSYKIDVCHDMETKLPKIIYYFKSIIWIYETSSYLGCVEKLLKEKYLRTSIMNSVWIRADIVASRDDLLEAAIIHDIADFNWIDDQKLRDRLKEIPKLNYKALSISKGNICLHKMEGGNRNISSGDCEDKNVLKVRLRTKGQISEMVTLPNMECVEVDGNSTEEDKNLRIWPCQNTLNQNFRILPSESGFHLRAENSNLCLNLSNKLLVQTNCEKAIEWKFKDVLKSDEDIF